MTKPQIRLLARILDFVFWATAILYTIGGVFYHGKLRLTYIQDFWTVCAVTYVLFRWIFSVRFQDTSFGKAAFDVMERFTAAVFQGRWTALRGMNVPSLVLSGILIYSLGLFFVLPLLNYWAGAGIWDTGIITNAVFNASRTGHFYTFFLTDGIHPLSYVPNNHLNLGLYLFAGIYRWFPRAELILVCQSAALLSGVFPLYRLGQRVLPRQMPSWYPVAIYLLWDSLYWMNVWDIHEAPFLIPLALWAFYFIEVEKLARALMFMTLMALWREDAWWTFAAMSLYLGFRTRRWGVALAGFVVGFALFPIHVMFFNRINTLGSRYPYLGQNFHEAIQILIADPLILFRVALTNSRFFRELLLRSGGGIFLFSGAAILPMIPGIGETALSAGMFHWTDHYVGNFLAPLMVANLYGWRNIDSFLSRKFPNRNRLDLLWKMSLVLAFTQLGFSLTGGFRGELMRGDRRACVKEVIKQIPASAALLASPEFAGSFANRYWLMSPTPDADQTSAQWLLSSSKSDLSAGMKGIYPTRPWVITWQGCEGLFVAKRAELHF